MLGVFGVSCMHKRILYCLHTNVDAGKKRDILPADDFLIPEAQGRMQQNHEHRKKKKRI